MHLLRALRRRHEADVQVRPPSTACVWPGCFWGAGLCFVSKSPAHPAWFLTLCMHLVHRYLIRETDPGAQCPAYIADYNVACNTVSCVTNSTSTTTSASATITTTTSSSTSSPPESAFGASAGMIALVGRSRASVSYQPPMPRETTQRKPPRKKWVPK